MAYTPTRKATANNANTTISIPAGFSIVQLVVENTTANAVTGGVKIGTTSGAIDVIVALATGASSLQLVSSATLLKNVFSTSADQTLFIQTVTSWNSAVVNFYFVLAQLI